MSLKFRRYLYIFFILSFLIITPIVSLYAAGYKFNEGFSIEKTGMLIINTEPKGAKIFLNGIERKNFFMRFVDGGKSSVTTPAKISNLLPGKYNIKIELDNYWPWEKELSIGPGRSTYIEDIYLFKKDLPFLLSSGSYSDLLLSPDKENFVAVDSETVNLINIKSGNKISYDASSTRDITFFEWSRDGDKLIVNDLLFFITNWDNPIKINQVLNEKISDIKFDDNNSNLIYYSVKNILYQYNLSSKISKKIKDFNNINTYIIKDSYLFIINDLSSDSELIIQNIGNNEIIKKIILPLSTYRFLSRDHGLLNVQDTKHSIFYLIANAGK